MTAIDMIKIIVFVICVAFGARHEYVSMKVSEPGYYKGVIVDKTTDSGRRSSTHYLLIDWEGIGQQSIIVHPLTYKRASVGDFYSTQLGYSPIFGAGGMAYAPNTDEYPLGFGLAGFFAKIIALFLLVEFCWSKLVKRGRRDDTSR